MNIDQLILWTKGTELEPSLLLSEHVDVFVHTVGVLQHMHDGDFFYIRERSDSRNERHVGIRTARKKDIQNRRFGVHGFCDETSGARRTVRPAGTDPLS